jgi:hypothetical protein
MQLTEMLVNSCLVLVKSPPRICAPTANVVSLCRPACEIQIASASPIRLAQLGLTNENTVRINKQ